jgi:hypothetical protein
MELDAQQIKSIVYALRFKIGFLKSAETDLTLEQDCIDAKNDRGYLQGLLGMLEMELRRQLALKPGDPV